MPYNIDDCNRAAAAKGGKCLSTEYKGIHIKMQWECKEGHVWGATFSNIKRDTWCRKCSIVNRGISQRLDLEECKDFAISKEGKCLSTEYISSKTHMQWECKEGHVWNTTFGHIKNSKSWCCKCSGKQVLSIEECRTLAISKGGKCVSTKYINAHTHMNWGCKEKHKWSATFSNIKRGKWCPTCSGNQPLNINDCREFAITKEGKCLSTEYISSKTHMQWECKEGHQWSARFDNIKQGNWCQKCKLCPSCSLWKTNGELCHYCIPGNYRKSKEYSVVKYLKQMLPDKDFIHNKSVGSQCTKDDRKNSNGHLFPDILFECIFYNLIVEVDEHKHSGADYKCDERRMYDIIAKLGQPCIFIRYNPDRQDSNKEILLEKINTYLNINIEDPVVWNEFGFKSLYLFY